MSVLLKYVPHANEKSLHDCIDIYSILAIFLYTTFATSFIRKSVGMCCNIDKVAVWKVEACIKCILH